MSVINKMLRDLDARRAAPGAAAASDAPAPRAAPAASRRLSVIVLGGAAALAGVAFGDWPKLLGGATAAAATAAPRDVAARLVEPALPAISLPPATASPDSATTDTATTAAPSVPTAKDESPTPPVATRSDEWPSRLLAAAPLSSRPDAAPAGSRSANPAPPVRTARLSTPSALPAGSAATANVAEAHAALTNPGTINKKMSAPGSEQRAQLAYQQALEDTASGHPHRALGQVLEALRLDPRHRGARHLAAVLLHEQGAAGRAAALLRDGLAQDPAQPALALLLARVLLDQGAPDPALEVLDRFALTSADAQGLRAGILAQQGDFKRSMNAYESALSQQPGNATWWLGLGVTLESDGQPQRARQAYARAQQIGVRGDELTTYLAQRLNALD